MMLPHFDGLPSRQTDKENTTDRATNATWIYHP